MAKNRKSGKKNIAHTIFIDGLSGMALGLFATLIVGTILAQISGYISGPVGNLLLVVGKTAQLLTGAGIGCGVAMKLGMEAPLVTISAAICGMVGAYAKVILAGSFFTDNAFGITPPGEPLGAFVAAIAGIGIGRLVSGKTGIDILLTPICCVLVGSAAGLFVGPYITRFMNWLGYLVNWGTIQQPFLMGIIVSVLMGIFLTLPISSAAIGVSLGLSGLAAGAATVGCCANMIGFAVASYRENKVGGLVAQGLGTSMLQIPNIIRHPQIWAPAIISSAVLGPISTMLFKMESNAVGSGMGTAGLVGPIMTYNTMAPNGNAAMVLGVILLMYFLLPALISLFISEGMRRADWIKPGYMKLDI
ncbi:MAG: PTS sugar transporter subunit IIC [Oscillospiraceae bacterium]|nr:PTS sugar transporter subunit IIC [Oscillospiraceae bacterium]